MSLPPLFRWTPGRQGTGYRKLPLVLWRRARGGYGLQGVDAYLLDYPAGAHAPRHRDTVPGESHYRLNIALLSGGSECLLEAEPVFRLGPVLLFRPDLVWHEVPPCTRRRLVFSVGWAVRRIENDLAQAVAAARAVRELAHQERQVPFQTQGILATLDVFDALARTIEAVGQIVGRLARSGVAR